MRKPYSKLTENLDFFLNSIELPIELTCLFRDNIPSSGSSNTGIEGGLTYLRSVV